MSEATKSSIAFSIPACVGLFALEVCYVFFLYDPVATRTQAGLTLIFAAEVGYMLKIANVQLKEKKAFGKISWRSRLYAASFMLPLLAVMTISMTAWHPALIEWLMAVLLLIALCGKIAWYRHYSHLALKDEA